LSDVSHQERTLLDVFGAIKAERFIPAQSSSYRQAATKALCENNRIFKRHAATLTQVWRARMSGITEQGHCAFSPTPEWRAIARTVS
jgi:hypothetical protein